MGDTAVVGPASITVTHEGLNGLYERAEGQPLLEVFKGFNWTTQPDTLTAKRNAIRFARASDHNETGMSVNEVGLLYDCLEQMGAGQIVELGRNFGTSTRLFIQHLLRHGGSLESWDLKHWPGFIEKLAEAGYRFEAKECDSDYSQLVHEPSGQVIKAVLKTAHSIKSPIEPEHRWINFLLIDTEHGLEDALGEVMRWRQYLNGGAFVAFHDSTLPGVMRAMEVYEEVESFFDGRLAAKYVNAQVDGFGVQVYRWKG